AATTVCQLYLRQFSDGDTLTLEPWRARAFPLIQDLVVDRSALDHLIEAGGYCSVNTGQAPDASAILVGREQALSAFNTATCIGCGACVASCRNASASLFVAAKLAHLAQLPQGQPERRRRAEAMQAQMAAEGFGSCSSNLECEAVCPKLISADWISWMQRESRG
ncbi:MAG: succinate dehydrogenase/fumarate reductase iron-sulfur subunit, partial [Cyanobacteriota bacterium]|nr:succinate dehydrogenase/fumarate reductase iron-sulfur subunit [Cyanobacteriota bacterium]